MELSSRPTGFRPLAPRGGCTSMGGRGVEPRSVQGDTNPLPWPHSLLPLLLSPKAENRAPNAVVSLAAIVRTPHHVVAHQTLHLAPHCFALHYHHVGLVVELRYRVCCPVSFPPELGPHGRSSSFLVVDPHRSRFPPFSIFSRGTRSV
jgi:hypothetical protein